MLFAFLYLQYISSMTPKWSHCTQQTTFLRKTILSDGLWEGYTRINNIFMIFTTEFISQFFKKNLFFILSMNLLWCLSQVPSRGCRALQISAICSWLLLLLASCWKTYASTAAFLYFHTLFCIYILNCCVQLCSDYISHKSECLLKRMFKNKLTENRSEIPFVKWLDTTETWWIW